MQKVAKASGANYSFHKETSSRFMDSGPQGPVVWNARSHPLLVFAVGEKKINGQDPSYITVKLKYLL